VANANAQLTSSDSPAGNAKAMTARANDILQAAPDNPTDAQPAAENQVVSSDQLNDIDRALHEDTPPAASLAMATAAAPAAPVAASRNESSTWDQTSLIGKIFIGFGALLTMASAARMFIA
jgi:phage-related tail fiber protein